MINRLADDFNNTSEGLRTALIIKTGGGPDWDTVPNKYFFENIYDVVIAEGESFAAADAGDKSWV